MDGRHNILIGIVGVIAFGGDDRSLCLLLDGDECGRCKCLCINGVVRLFISNDNLKPQVTAQSGDLDAMTLHLHLTGVRECSMTCKTTIHQSDFEDLSGCLPEMGQSATPNCRSTIPVQLRQSQQPRERIEAKANKLLAPISGFCTRLTGALIGLCSGTTLLECTRIPADRDSDLSLKTVLSTRSTC